VNIKPSSRGGSNSIAKYQSIAILIAKCSSIVKSIAKYESTTKSIAKMFKYCKI